MDTERELGQIYRPRVIDTRLNDLLGAAGAVVIEGPRACGKTMTGLHHANSYAQLDDPRTRAVMQVDPSVLVRGDAPRLLDEWQLAPDLWNMVRRAVDARLERGQFILTGSAVPVDDVTRHTGAGRFLRLRQRTMTWFEKLSSASSPGSRTVSLAALFDGELPEPDLAGPGLDDVVRGVLMPGFPALTPLAPDKQAIFLNGYLDKIARADVPRLGDTRHGPQTIRHLLASIARLTASELKYSTLTADLHIVAPSIRSETVASYVELLERLFVVELVPPFATKLRSRAKLRISPKLHMADPALVAAAMHADAAALTADVRTLGFLFESAVVHDLLVMTEALGGHVYHYRDSNGHEIDAVLMLGDGRWAAVEVKLGGSQIDVGANSLRKAVAQIDADRPPQFMAVITGTGYTARREGDVITFPLSALCP